MDHQHDHHSLSFIIIIIIIIIINVIFKTTITYVSVYIALPSYEAHIDVTV